MGSAIPHLTQIDGKLILLRSNRALCMRFSKTLELINSSAHDLANGRNLISEILNSPNKKMIDIITPTEKGCRLRCLMASCASSVNALPGTSPIDLSDAPNDLPENGVSGNFVMHLPITRLCGSLPRSRAQKRAFREIHSHLDSVRPMPCFPSWLLLRKRTNRSPFQYSCAALKEIQGPKGLQDQILRCNMQYLCSFQDAQGLSSRDT
jgi:hypothetical protein